MNLANHFTIIRSYQKDDYYRSKLRLQLRNLMHTFLKPSICLKYSKEFNLISDFFYYLTTTLNTRQTIGQEYCNLILFDELKRNIPSKLKRYLLIFIKIFLPYLLYYIKIKHISFDLFKLVFYYLNSFNTIYFFLTKSTFYKFENFLTNIKYIDLQDEDEEAASGSSKNGRKRFYFLALSLFVPLVYNIYVDLKKLKIYLSQKSVKNNEIEEKITTTTTTTVGNDDRKCLLCLDRVKEPTLTPCGHLYCWYCIQEYTQRSYSHYEQLLNIYHAHCPICREKYKINKLIFLHNY